MEANKYAVTLGFTVNAKDVASAQQYAEMMAGYIYRYDMNKLDDVDVLGVTELD